jgi:hypothetical protein
MGWDSVLVGVQYHGRVGPGWVLEARDGGGRAGFE